MVRPVVMILRKEIVRDKAICNVMGVAIFTVLTIIGGYIRIPLPFTPVPITAQTFFVILAGAFLGSRLGSASQIFYVILGAFGLPVFQNCASGFAYMAGPTGGYLLGFIIAPFVVGKLIALKEDAAFWWAAASMAIGSFVILALGAVYLVQILHIGLREGFTLGVLYFLPGDIVKIIAAASFYMAFRVKIGRIFRLNG